MEKRYDFTYDELNRMTFASKAGIATSYDEWGNIRASFGCQVGMRVLDKNKSYTGHAWDAVQRMHHAEFRMYDPENKRFTQIDPIKDGRNWYLYVGDNSMNWIDPLGKITEKEIELFESGRMAPAAYTYLMELTYDWHLADTQKEKDALRGKAERFRSDTVKYGYDPKTKKYFDTGFCQLDKDIRFMPSLPTSSLTMEQHYFRNRLNIEYQWADFQKLQKRLPEKLKWVGGVKATLHQFSAPIARDNKKYVSADGHFEMMFSKGKVLLSEENAPLDMGTYNYYSPTKNPKLHTWYDVATWVEWGNVKKEPIMNVMI